jgi:hypothetical protein
VKSEDGVMGGACGGACVGVALVRAWSKLEYRVTGFEVIQLLFSYISFANLLSNCDVFVHEKIL